MKTFKIFALFVVLPIHFLSAAENESPGMKLLADSCQEEIKKFCPTAEGPRFLMMCLKKEEEKISIKCKEDLARTISSSRQSSSRGGGSFSSFGGFSLTPSSSSTLSYEGRFIPSHNSPSLNEEKINFSTPLIKKDGHFLSLGTQAGILHMNESQQLSSGFIVPKEYYRTELGLNYLEMFPEKKSWGVRTSLGYNSDKILKSSRDLSFSLSSHYSFPSTEQSSWALTLYFSNNGPFANYIPIPGFIYFYRTPTFTGIFGVPFLSLQWTPDKDWLYSFSLFGANINTEAAYGSLEHFQYFTGLSWVRQSFMLHNRVNQKDRLNFEEKKIFLGLRTSIFNFISSEIQLGDSFGRELYIGDKLLNKSGGRKQLDSSAYASWSVRMMF